MCARSGMLRQSYRQFPPEHCAPHSMMWPAMIPAASLSQSVAPQPNSWRSGAIVSAVSVARPPLADRGRPDVRVGGQHTIAHGTERLTGLHVRERMAIREQLVEARQ